MVLDNYVAGFMLSGPTWERDVERLNTLVGLCVERNINNILIGGIGPQIQIMF